MGTTRLERLVAVLILQAMRDRTIAEKSAALATAGLSHAEIADLVGTTSAVVSQSLYEARKKKRPSKEGRSRS
jgi:predicted transcriptional regulator